MRAGRNVFFGKVGYGWGISLMGYKYEESPDAPVNRIMCQLANINFAIKKELEVGDRARRRVG